MSGINKVKNICTRCRSANIISDPLVVKCKDCKCHSFYNGNKLLTTSFIVDKYNVRINFAENKTYINKTDEYYSADSFEIGKNLSPDISIEKLKLYLTFS